MSYASNQIFDSTELAAISAARAAAAISGDYTGAYQTIIDLITDNNGDALYSSDEDVLTFLQAAKDINGDTSAYGSFVRSYTESQYQIRFGEAPPSGFIQASSNAVAEQTIGAILSAQTIPSIATIAEEDGGVVTDEFFDGDAGAWSGNLLFLAFGYDDAFNSQIVPEEHDTYNVLAMCKAIQDYGVISTFVTFLTDIVHSYFSDHDMVFEGMVDAGDYLADSYGGLGGLLSLGGYTVEYDIALGTRGNDVGVEGGEGNSIVHGGDGDDSIVGNVAPDGDILDGGNGDDTADYTAFAGGLTFNIYGSESYTSPLVGVVWLGFEDAASVHDVEHIVGTAYDDTFAIADVTEILKLQLSEERQLSLDGGADEEVDTLDLSSAETTYGTYIDTGNGELWISLEIEEEEQEMLVGISGFESFVGSALDDYLLADEHFISFDGGDGFDILELSAALTLDGEGLDDLEQVQGSAGGDSITYGDGPILLYGGGGADTLVGSDDDDLLSGGGIDLADDGALDTLAGGEGADAYHVESFYAGVSHLDFHAYDTNNWKIELDSNLSTSLFTAADRIDDSDGDGTFYVARGIRRPRAKSRTILISVSRRTISPTRKTAHSTECSPAAISTSSW